MKDFDSLYEEFGLQDTVLKQQMSNGELASNDNNKANPWTGLIIKTSPFPFLTPKPGKCPKNLTFSNLTHCTSY